MICACENGRHSEPQDLLREGVRCWVLHPTNGIRPVAEGIAGSAPPSSSSGLSICRSLLMELCEEGQQTVKVTKLYKKKMDLMFPHRMLPSMCLDDYVVPPAPSDTVLTWSSMYLVEKHDDD